MPFDKLLALFFLVITTTALPAPPSALDNVAALPCQSEYARCLRHDRDVDLCHDLVCSYYGNKVNFPSFTH